MNILFIVPYIPNLIRTRPFNLIRELSNRGHAVTVATLWTNEKEKVDLAELSQTVHRVEAAKLTRRQSYWNCMISLPTKKPLQSVYCSQPVLERRLESIISNGGKVRPLILFMWNICGAFPSRLKCER